MRFLRPSWDHGSFSSKGCNRKQLMDWLSTPFDMPAEEKLSEGLHFAWIFLLQHVISYQQYEHSSRNFHKLNLEWIVSWF